MLPAIRLRAAPVRTLLVTWGLMLGLLFAGCEGNGTKSFAIPGDELNTVRGRVYNTINGADLSNATVKLIPEGQTFVTSATGTFRLQRVTEGSHRIEVSRAGFNTRVQGILMPNRGLLALDVGLYPDTFQGTVSGTVLDAETGNPLAGVRVTVPEQATTVPLPGGMPRPVATAVTDANGRFSLGPVGAGRVSLTFDNATHRVTSVIVDVPKDGNADAVFRLLLTSGAIAGTVRSTRDTNPLTSAEVSIVSSSARTLTDARGAYTLGPLFAGNYFVEYNAPGHDRLQITTSVFPGRTTVANVTLRFNLARLTGTITGPSGSPLANAVVSLPALNVTTRTNAAGMYDFGFTLRSALPLAPVSIGVSAQNLQPAAGFVVLNPGLTAVADFQLVSSTGNLIGQVASAVNGQAVIGATVSIPTLNQGRVTDLFGSFTFFAIPAQVHQVNINAAGFTPLTTLVPVFSGQTNSVRFLLNP